MTGTTTVPDHILPVTPGRALLGIDILRHVLILCVIFQHMLSETRYSGGVNAHIHHVIAYIDGAVAGFFLLSGYFARPLAVAAAVRRQARRLLLPYLLFCALNAVLLVGLGKIGVRDIVPGFLRGGGIGPQLYFLLYLFVISVLFAAVERLLPTRAARWGFPLLLAACLGLCLLLPTISSTGPDLHLLPFYALSYGLGIWLARNRVPRAYLALVAAAALACLLLPAGTRFWDLGLIVLLTTLALRVSRLDLPKVRLPGSGGVYLLHTPILNFALSTVLLRLGIGGIPNLYLALAATYLIALAATLVVIRLAPRLRHLLLE